MIFRCSVCVIFKENVPNPEESQYLSEVESYFPGQIKIIRPGKYFEILIDADTEGGVIKIISDISQRLLSNPVYETFRILRIKQIDMETE